MAETLSSISVVPVPGHPAHLRDAFLPIARLPVQSRATVTDALHRIPAGGDILIAGSLYLAGQVLRLNWEVPD